jgi:hypothetical protein
MMDDVPRPPLGDGHVHGVDHELGLQIVAHRPPHDTTRPSVQHDGQVDEARPCRHAGDVRHPELVRLVGPEIPVDKIVGWPDPAVPDRGARAFSAAYACQSRCLLQPFDTLAANVDTLISQLGMDARRAVGLFGRAVNLDDPFGQAPIRHGARRWCARSPCMETAARYAQNARHGLDRENGLVRGHQFEDLDEPSSSLANQAAAFDRMSRSMRSRRFSLRRRRSSSRSGLVGPSILAPPSIPDCLTQPAMVAAQGSNSRARLSTLRPAPASAMI